MNLESRQKLSNLLFTLRGSKSRRGFARELGVSATAIISWEKTDNEPDVEHLNRIAKLAGYTLDELMTYLEGRDAKKSDTMSFARILTETSRLGVTEAAQLYRAVGDRLVAIAESAGR